MYFPMIFPLIVVFLVIVALFSYIPPPPPFVFPSTSLIPLGLYSRSLTLVFFRFCMTLASPILSSVIPFCFVCSL